MLYSNTTYTSSAISLRLVLILFFTMLFPALVSARVSDVLPFMRSYLSRTMSFTNILNLSSVNVFSLFLNPFSQNGCAGRILLLISSFEHVPMTSVYVYTPLPFLSLAYVTRFVKSLKLLHFPSCLQYVSCNLFSRYFDLM